MSVNTQDTGTGNETASQVASAPEAQPPADTQNGQDSTIQSIQSQPGAIPLDEIADNASENADTATPPPADEPPAPVELSFPEGFEADEAKLSKFQEMVAKGKVSPELAQEMFDFHHEELKAGITNFADKWALEVARLNEAEYKEIMDDPNLGGANFEVNREKVGMVLRKFATPELTTSLKKRAFANNPHLFRMLVNIADYVGEPGAAGTGGSVGNAREESLGEILHPNLVSKG